MHVATSDRFFMIYYKIFLYLRQSPTSFPFYLCFMKAFLNHLPSLETFKSFENAITYRLQFVSSKVPISKCKEN